MTWATSMPILVFLGLSVLELGPMYATDRRQTKASLNASTLWGRRHNNKLCGRPPHAPAPCKLTFDLFTLKMVSEFEFVNLCANFSLPRPLCSRLRPDIYDRQTDVRHASSLINASARVGGITRGLATANKSHVSVRGRLCRNFPYT